MTKERKITSWLHNLKRFTLPLSVAVLIALCFLAYGQILKGYFAADEWWALGFAISRQSLKEVFETAGIFAPGANLFIWLLYKAFGVNATAWALLALLLHIVNTHLLFWSTTRLSSRIEIGFFVAALFAILPMGSQFVDQFSLMPTSGIATTLGFLALLAYSYRYIWLTALLFFVSLLFSAYTVPFMLFIGLYEVVFIERKQWYKSLLRLLPVGLIFGIYYLLLRSISLNAGGLYDRPVTEGQSILERLMLVVQKAYQGYAEILLRQPGLIDPVFMVRYSTFIVIVAVTLIGILWHRKQYRLARTALVGLLWIPASLLLFSTLSTVALNVTFPGRYFYVGTVGIGLLLGSILIGLGSLRSQLWPGQLILAICLVGLLFHYLPQTKKEVLIEVHSGQDKQLVMNAITQAVQPPLSQRDGLFCFTSNTGHFATGPEVIPLPYVINFNFPLAVVYRSNEPRLYPLFQKSDYFVNPAASWYYYSHPEGEPWKAGPGIGFATNIADCQKLLSLYPFITLDGVYGFAYDGPKKKVTNITEALRTYLAGDTTVRDQLYPW